LVIHKIAVDRYFEKDSCDLGEVIGSVEDAFHEWVILSGFIVDSGCDLGGIVVISLISKTSAFNARDSFLTF